MGGGGSRLVWEGDKDVLMASLTMVGSCCWRRGRGIKTTDLHFNIQMYSRLGDSVVG